MAVVPSSVLEAGWLASRPHGAFIALVLLPVACVMVAGSRAIFPAELAPVLLAGIALGLAVMIRPRFGAFLLVATVPGLSGLGRGMPIPGLRLSEVLAVGVGAAILVSAGRYQALRWSSLDWLFLAYVLATFFLGWFNLARRGAPVDTDALGVMIMPIQFFVLYRAVATGLCTPSARAKGLRVLLLATIPVSGLAIVQQLDIGGTRSFVATITATDIFENYAYQGFARTTGPFPHWHLLAGYLVPVIVLCVGLLLSRSEVMSTRTISLVLALATAALVMTTTFAALLGAVAAVLLVAGWLGGLRRLLVWLLPAVLVIAVLFGSLLGGRYEQQFISSPAEQRSALVPATIAARFDIWAEQYVPAVAPRLLTGYGPDLPPEIDWEHTESLYIALLLRGGLPLLALFGGLSVAVAARARRLGRSTDPSVRVLAYTTLAVVVVLVPMHMVFPYFINTGMPHMFWAIAALLAAGVTSERTHSMVVVPVRAARVGQR